MKTYTLHLIRHGLTQGNLDGVFVGGGLDMSICEQGAEELRSLAAQYTYPNVGVLFSSPMKRALESADILYPDIRERIIIEELRENRFGEFEGMQVKDMMQNGHFMKWLNPEENYTPEGGESGASFAARTAEALKIMQNYQAKNGITQAACLTHGGVIMSMLAQQGIPQKPPHQWMSDNGCGFSLRYDAAMLMRDGMVEVVDILPLGYPVE